MASDFYLSSISNDLKGIREELARANRLKKYELEQKYDYDPKIQKAYAGIDIGLNPIHLNEEEEDE